MKTLVVYYSRTGHTKALAQEIGTKLGAEIDEIADKKPRKGVIGWLGAGKDATSGKPTEIEFGKDASAYDLVVAGTPVWGGSMAPAIRSYLTKNKLGRTAFFCSCKAGPGKAFEEMQALAGRPVATLALKEKEAGDNAKIEDFCLCICRLRKNETK